MVTEQTRARITLGRILIGSYDHCLGQCSMSYLKGINEYDLMIFSDVSSLYFLDSNGNCKLGNESMTVTPNRGSEYEKWCDQHAYDYARKMKKKGVTEYELINGKWIEMGECTGELVTLTSRGSEITPFPEEAIEFFRTRLEERLN